MPQARVRFHPEADAEVEAARQWYVERSAVAARAFATEVSWCVERVRESPERWPRYVYGTRRYLLPNFPFSLVYRVHWNEVEIIAVAHHRRKPAYWSGR